jgi:hemerythrin-like domain-containing protein
MQATETLECEHAVIERALNLLEIAVVMIRAGRCPPDGFQPWIVRFIRDFADRRHHVKEEEVLFPLLEQRGIPCDGGPIGCMLHEHELGRDCVRRMREALPPTGDDPAGFSSAAEDYVGLLRQHIFKENNVLFMMAQRCLSPQDDKSVVEKYRAAVARDGGPDVANRFEAELAQFERSFATSAEADRLTQSVHLM